MKKFVALALVVLAPSVMAGTTTFVEKYFTVSNANPNATGPLIGTARMASTNSPFYIPTKA
jgi:hypothetical protein